MSILGIIAEYNPFHTGHLYHLTEAKKMTSAEGVICAMSGNFMQRGEPGIVNKWARAEMALAHGADLVLELPVLYSCRSSYWFARGGIQVLHRTGLVTHLAFGVETYSPGQFTQMASLLAAEPPEYRVKLKAALKKGYSFPRARSQALSAASGLTPTMLDRPNNVLGLTYLQVLEETGIPLIPVFIERSGAGYNEPDLTEGVHPSATAIRRQLSSRPHHIPTEIINTLNSIRHHLPEATFRVLAREFARGQGPVLPEYLTPQVMTLLRRTREEDLREIVDISEGLENRIGKTALESVNLQDFLKRLKTKRYTYTRLQRFLIHLLLNYTREKEQYLAAGPPYLRVLGFSRAGRRLLKEMKARTGLPIITKGAHSRKFSNEDKSFQVFWEMDVLATDLYSLAYPREPARKGGLDYLTGPVSCPR